MSVVGSIKVVAKLDIGEYTKNLALLEKKTEGLSASGKAVSGVDKNTKDLTKSMAKATTVGTVLGNVVNKGLSTMSGLLDGAIKRTDTMNRFPRIMENLGVSSEDANKALEKLNNGILGLPTGLDDAALSVQRLTSSTGDVDEATNIFLAFNNALTSGQAPMELQRSAMEQFSQAVAKGKPDMVEWRSLLSAMPAQIKAVAKHMFSATGAVDKWIEKAKQMAKTNPLSKAKDIVAGLEGVKNGTADMSSVLGDALRNNVISMDEFTDALVEVNEKGSGETKAFKDTVKGNVSGIDTAITLAEQAVTRGMQAILNSIGTEKIQKAFDTMGRTFEKVMNILADGFKWVEDNTHIFSWLADHVDLLAYSLVGIAGIMATVKIGKFFGGLASDAKRAVTSIGGLIGHLKKIKKPLEDVSSAGKLAGSGVDKMTTATKKSQSTFPIFKNIEKLINGITISIKALVKGAGGIGVELAKAIGDIGKTIAKETPKIFKELGVGVANAFKAIGTAVSNPTILAGMAGVVGMAGTIKLAFELLNPVLLMLVDTVTYALETLTPPIEYLVNAVIIPALNSIMSLLSRLTNEVLIPLGEFIVSSLLSTLEALGNTFEKVGNTISGAVESVGTSISGVIDSISGFISSIGTALSDLVTAVSDGIANIIDAFGRLFKNVNGTDWYGLGFGVTRNLIAGLLDGLVQLLQDGLNKIINNLLSVPVIGEGLKLIGVKENPINLSGFKLGKYATGGFVRGVGTSTSDSNPALLSRGEYVVNARAVDILGIANLDLINRGVLPQDSRSKPYNVITNNYYQLDRTANSRWQYEQVTTGAAA